MVYQPLEFRAAAVCRFITVSSIILVPEATVARPLLNVSD